MYATQDRTNSTRWALLCAFAATLGCAPQPEPEAPPEPEQPEVAAQERPLTAPVYPLKSVGPTYGEITMTSSWELRYSPSADELSEMFQERVLIPGPADDNPFVSGSRRRIEKKTVGFKRNIINQINNVPADSLLLLDLADLDSADRTDLINAPFSLSSDELLYMDVDDQAYYIERIDTSTGHDAVVILGGARGLQYGLTDFLAYSTWDASSSELVWGEGHSGGAARVFNYPDVHQRISHQTLFEFTLFKECDVMSATGLTLTQADFEACIENLNACSPSNSSTCVCLDENTGGACSDIQHPDCACTETNPDNDYIKAPADRFTELLQGKFTHVLEKSGQYENPTPVRTPDRQLRYGWLLSFLEKRNVRVIPSISGLRSMSNRTLQGPRWDSSGSRASVVGADGDTGVSEGLRMSATLQGTCDEVGVAPETCGGSVAYQVAPEALDSIIDGNSLGQDLDSTSWRVLPTSQTTLGRVLCGQNHTLKCDSDTTGRHWEVLSDGKVQFDPGDTTLSASGNDSLHVPLVFAKEAAPNDWERGEHLMLRARVTPTTGGTALVDVYLNAWAQGDRPSRSAGAYRHTFSSAGWLSHVFKVPDVTEVEFGPDGVLKLKSTSVGTPHHFNVMLRSAWGQDAEDQSDSYTLEDVEIIRLEPRLAAVRGGALTITDPPGTSLALSPEPLSDSTWRSPIDTGTGEVVDATFTTPGDVMTVSGSGPSVIQVEYTSELVYAGGGPTTFTANNVLHYIPDDNTRDWVDDASALDSVATMFGVPRPDYVMLHGSDELRGVARQMPASDWLISRFNDIHIDIEPHLPVSETRRMLWADMFSRFWIGQSDPNYQYLYGGEAGSAWPARRTFPEDTTLVAWHYGSDACNPVRRWGFGFTYLDLLDLTGALSDLDRVGSPLRPRTPVIGAGWRSEGNFIEWAAMATQRSDAQPDSNGWEPAVEGLEGLMAVEWGVDYSAQTDGSDCATSERLMAGEIMWNAPMELLAAWHLSTTDFPKQESATGGLSPIVESWTVNPPYSVEEWDGVRNTPGYLYTDFPSKQTFLSLGAGGSWLSPLVALRQHYGTGMVHSDEVVFQVSERAYPLGTALAYNITLTQYGAGVAPDTVTQNSSDWQHTSHTFTLDPTTTHVMFEISVDPNSMCGGVPCNTQCPCLHMDSPAVFQRRPEMPFPTP